MSLKVKNNARSKLAVGISPTETTIRVSVGDGSKYPVITGINDWFPLALEDQSGNIEYLRATAREGDSITVQRAAEGSIPRQFYAGDLCELRLTAAALGELSGDVSPGVVPQASISDAVLGDS